MYSKAENFPGKAVSDGKAQKVSAKQTNNGQKSAAIFQRIAAAGKTAVKECLDAYGNLVWSLAKKFTGLNLEAEAATQEIFLDIWKYANRFDEAEFSEKTFIVLVAYCCLTKREVNQVSVAKGSVS